MKKYIQTYIVALILGLCLIPHMSEARPDGQPKDGYPAAHIPDALKKDANAVVRWQREEFLIQNPGKAALRITRAVTILNKKAEEEDLEMVMVSYDGDLIEAEILYGNLYDANGKLVRTLKKKDITDQSYTGGSLFQDTRIKHASMQDDRYPYTVEYSYEQEFDGLFYYPDFAPQTAPNISVQYAEMHVLVPKGMDIRYTTHNFDGEPESIPTNKHVGYLWKVENLPAIDPEPFSPPFRELRPTVLLAPIEFKISGYEGKMNTWGEFGKFIYELNEGRDELPEEMAAKVRAMVAGLETPHEKIDTLYRFLQANTRYVSVQLGIGGYQTFDAEYVYENGYGDCKALSNYMKAMLNVIEIPSHMGIIYRGHANPKVSPTFPTQQFNHAILCVPLASDTIWLECTNSHSLTGYMDRSTSDRYAVLATPEGGKLARTPSFGPTKNRQNRKAEITLQEDGAALIKVKTIYSGYQQDYLEDIIGSYSDREKEDWLRDDIELGSYDLISYELGRVEGAKLPSCYLTYDLKARNCAALSGTRIFLAPNLLGKWGNVPEKLEKRTQPVKFRYPYVDADTLTYLLPKGYSIENMADMPIQITSKFGEYEANVTVRPDGQITYTRRLQMNKVEFPAETYEELRQFLKEIVKADKIQIVLSNKS